MVGLLGGQGSPHTSIWGNGQPWACCCKPVWGRGLGVGSQIFSDTDLQPRIRWGYRILPSFWALGTWVPRSHAGPEHHLLCILKLWPLACPPTPHIFLSFGNSSQSTAIRFYDFWVHPLLISALSPWGPPMKLTELTPFSRSWVGLQEWKKACDRASPSYLISAPALCQFIALLPRSRDGYG